MLRLTIGIPTYNRAGYLRRAIETALDQTHPEVEVLVSDDASTDETPEVVRSIGGRVRYHRNPENIGSWPNFVRVAELASGEYFSWLQDDDLVHRDFARRASQAMDGDDDVAVYAAFEVEGPSATVFYQPVLYGPPIALGWMRSELRIIDGALVAPLEANACGTSAVGIAEGGIRESVDHGLNGWLVEADDPVALGQSLARTVNDLDLAREEGLRARNHIISRWRVEDAADRLEAHLVDALRAGHQAGVGANEAPNCARRGGP